MEAKHIIRKGKVKKRNGLVYKLSLLFASAGSVLSFGMFLLMGAAISATCLSSISLRNHESFVRCKLKENEIIIRY